MLKVYIDQTAHTIEVRQNNITVDGEPWDWDLEKINGNLYHLIKNSRSYTIAIVSADPTNKKIQLKINGMLFETVIRDKYDILLEKLGMNQNNQSNHLEVKAPMPGKILDVLVSQGQQVKKGDQMVVLEAMKMENVIKSAGDGVVTSVYVRKGMNVEKNQVLIQF
jgi:biotin carboxyl carrier protein